jgi:hypothetical protein
VPLPLSFGCALAFEAFTLFVLARLLLVLAASLICGMLVRRNDAGRRFRVRWPASFDRRGNSRVLAGRL